MTLLLLAISLHCCSGRCFIQTGQKIQIAAGFFFHGGKHVSASLQVIFLYQLEAKKSDSDSVHGRFLWASLTGGMHELFPTDSQFNFQPPEDTSASLTQPTRPGDQKQTKKKQPCALASFQRLVSLQLNHFGLHGLLNSTKVLVLMVPLPLPS